MDKYIIGFDPGKTTGCAILSVTDYSKHEYDLAAHYIVPWDLRDHIKDILNAFKNAGQIDAIVIEDFKLYATKAQDMINNEMHSAKVIERITVYCEELGLVDKIIQPLPMASALYRSKGLKWPIPSEHNRLLQTQHAKDAYLHARVWFMSQ